MMRSICFHNDGTNHENLSREEIRARIANPDELLWILLEAPTEQELYDVLQNLFQFHSLAIEDCIGENYQSPKIDDFGHYLFIIAHAIRPDKDIKNFEYLETVELDIFLGQNYVVTVHHSPKMSAIETVWNRLQRDERLHSNGADFLCHAILDVLVDEYLPVLDRMDDEIDWLEDRILSAPDPNTLKRILALKHSLIALRRIISPQREVMNRLSRDDFPMIDQKARIYYRNIYDHLVRIQDLSESIRDIVTSTLDTYLNSTSLKLNEIMKTLTIVSTIFLPLTFISGIFGMNFLFNIDYHWSEGAPVFLFLCIASVLTMLIIYKRSRWL